MKLKEKNGTNGEVLYEKFKAEEIHKKTLIQIKLKTRANKNLFGYIIGGRMHEKTEAKITSKVWLELPFEFHYVKLLHYSVTPNEFNAIIEVDHITGKSQSNASEEKYKRNGNWRRAEMILKKEHCKILVTRLVSTFKARTTKLLNQLHGTPARILWENAYEETEIAEVPLNEISYLTENIIQPTEKVIF